MTENMGLLRQLSTGGVAAKLLPTYSLTNNQTVVIGRDPSCQLVLDANLYSGVSRRHAIVRPSADVDSNTWEIYDLGSANGTYLNGQQLFQPQILQSGDRITLSQNGPKFIFEYRNNSSRPKSSLRKGTIDVTSKLSPSKDPDSLTFTQLFPLASTGRDLTKKAFLVPAIFTVVFVVFMFASIGDAAVFNFLLAAYLSGAAYYYIYQLCGKKKPWWIILASCLTTILLLLSPVLSLFILIFREILPGTIPATSERISLISLLIHMFFGAGLMEELLKALPVLGAFLWGRCLPSPWRERIGVWEPLDAIILATASAVGFTLLETLGQYVPNIIHDVTLQAGEGAGELVGLHLLIPRILGSVSGHMAYSGYLGYFIGLSVLKPSKSVPILFVGYLSASFLHALWNTTGVYNPWLLTVVGIISYAFLAAAILKARTLSPTREQNFATHFSNKS